ncbi:MAG: acetyl-CoA carboxylase biotin carboxyl carrier protein subunit [Rubrivivax sp.]
MQAHEIKALIDAMAASDLTELHAARDGWSLRLVRGRAAAASSASSRATAQASSGANGAAENAPHVADSTADELHAPLGGVVFLQSAPGEPPFVRPGQSVQAGDTVCVIEAMKVFNAVHAEHDGVVAAVLVASGQEVDAGQPLLRLARPST